jgi:chaperone modulatory protein CbpM
MRAELADLVWLDEHHEVSLVDLARLSGLSEAEVIELVECGAIARGGTATGPGNFRAECVVVARTACRLRNDFELDAQGLALVLTLLERVRDLEARVRELRAQQPAGIR